MIILAYLVLLVILLGIGILVASILPTRGARIGLGSVLFLALVVDGMWFVAPLAEWSSSLGDRVWLGAFALVALGAGAVALYYRDSADQPAWTWPSDRDVAFLILVIMLFGVIIWALPVPLDTDAQGFGYLSLMLRESGEYTTLAPWHPEIDYLYSPGQISLIAYLSARFDFSIASIELIFSAAAAVLFVWMAYDLGSELEGPRGARAFMLAAVIGTGLFTAFMDSHYTALLALDFSLAFLIFVLRFLHSWRWSSALFASICLAGVPLTQPDTTIALMIGYIPWLLVIWLSKPRPGFGAWLVLVAVIPLVALGITAPWLISITDLLGTDIESPFAVDLDHWRTLIFMHGGIIVLLAAVGVLIGLVRRHPAHLLMITWLVAIVEFSTLGLLEENLPDLMEPLLKYDYPFSLAWHGPIIPYTVLGGTALLWLADRLGAVRIDRWVRRLAFPVAAVGITALVAGAIYIDPVLETSKDYLDIYGSFASAADVDAMLWLRDNAPEDARILNHPGPYEGDWVPVIAERDSVYFRSQPFFRDVALTEQEQDDLRVFWENPTSEDAAALLEQYNVRYVLVPQVFGDPDRFTEMVRWREPVDEATRYDVAAIRRASYLRLIYEQDGAQVYEVIPPEQR
jgi:hypothetical protein